ncbi:MAG: hypothetical protein M3Y65_15445 [Pseudomonadota bacterium]|nr:hypothetical protein [Pseudomonadota bacterium]
MSDYIVCGKFDGRVGFGTLPANPARKRRLHANQKVPQPATASWPVAAGMHTVWFAQRDWQIDAFLSHAVANNMRRLIVLTTKEYWFLAERAVDCGVHIVVFETSFPLFTDIRYQSLLRANLDVLTKHLSQLKNVGLSSEGMSKQLATRYQRTVAKRLGYKNGYDSAFFFAYKNGYQEVFKLYEERPDHVIVALDFNSMFIDSMKGEFCDPASIVHVDFHDAAPALANLQQGIYRVRLRSAKASFLFDHHPFLYKLLGRSHHFRMKRGDTIETLLQKDEVVYFAPFFEGVELLEGLCSPRTISHPLGEDGRALYGQRMYHRRRGDTLRENFCKIAMQHMHSATNQKRYRTHAFEDLDHLRTFLSTRFLLDLDRYGDEELIVFLTTHQYFRLARITKGYRLSCLDTDSASTVLSLSAQVVANARLTMLKTVERFLRFPSVELCYANVDSLHLSMRRDALAPFLEEHSTVISQELGALKVEAIADSGYWFDVGRYWLKKDGQTVLFKNKGFNHVAATDAFTSRRKVKRLIETPFFTHVSSFVAKLENAFEYRKRLDVIGTNHACFARFEYEEIQDAVTMNMTESHERLLSMTAKTELFQRIAQP